MDSPLSGIGSDSDRAPAGAGKPASNGRLVGIFTAFFVGMLLLFFVIVFIASTYFNLPFENSAMGVILIFIAASSTGNAWYNREKVLPSSARKWVVAFLSSFVVTAFQGMLFYVLAYSDEQIMREMAGEDFTIVLAILGGLFVFNILTIRVGLWAGTRQGLKGDARKLAKAAR